MGTSIVCKLILLVELIVHLPLSDVIILEILARGPMSLFESSGLDFVGMFLRKDSRRTLGFRLAGLAF